MRRATPTTPSTEPLQRLIKLCVLATEHLTRPSPTAAPEYQVRSKTSLSLIGQTMFPRQEDERGFRVAGARNAQGAALSASRWVRMALSLRLLEVDWHEHGRGFRITDLGVRRAAEWITEPFAKEWQRLRDQERTQGAARRKRIHAVAKRRKNRKRMTGGR